MTTWKWTQIVLLVVAATAWTSHAFMDEVIRISENASRTSKTTKKPDKATPGSAQEGSWTIQMDFHDQIFPSFVVSTATMQPDNEANAAILGDANGSIGIQVVSPSNLAPIHVAIEAGRYIHESHFSGTLPKRGETYWIYPKLDYDFEALRELSQQLPVNLRIKVQLGDLPPQTQLKTVILRSINDCPLAVYHLPEGKTWEEADEEEVEVVDVSWMIAAYVNENHPWIQEILKEALTSEIVDSFDGYQSEDPQQVYAQVFAVWHALRSKGVRYSDITANAEGSPLVSSQHVRFIEETVRHSQANCVDGSVVLASILRKIGLKCQLALVPGHCYLTFALDENEEDFAGLETTLIGSKEFDKPSGLDSAMRKLARSNKTLPSWPSFAAAISVGTEELKEQIDSLADEDEADYLLVDIESARQLGIMPLGYHP